MLWYLMALMCAAVPLSNHSFISLLYHPTYPHCLILLFCSLKSSTSKFKPTDFLLFRSKAIPTNPLFTSSCFHQNVSPTSRPTCCFFSSFYPGFLSNILQKSKIFLFLLFFSRFRFSCQDPPKLVIQFSFPSEIHLLLPTKRDPIHITLTELNNANTNSIAL